MIGHSVFIHYLYFHIFVAVDFCSALDVITCPRLISLRLGLLGVLEKRKRVPLLRVMAAALTRGPGPTVSVSV